MAIQKDFSIDHKIGYVGQAVDGQLKNFVSRTNTTDATIPFGAPVFGDGKSTGTVENFIGIALREVANRSYINGTVAGYEVGKTMSVLTDGVIYIEAPEAVTAYSKVYLETNAIAVTGTTELPGARFVSDAKKGEIVKLQLTIGA